MGDRKRELARLCQLVTDALKEGWIPGESAPGQGQALPVVIHMVNQIQQAQTRFEVNGWSKPYKRDMNRLVSEFTEFLNLNHPLAKLTDITPTNLAAFLDAYRSSGRYYMNKRRNLSALYTLLNVEPNPVRATPTMKVTEHLNEAYSPDEMMKVLQFLTGYSPNLYLCALFTYGTLLRPHREVRLLQRKNFDATLDFLLLAGSAVKNGKIRKVPVPDYIVYRQPKVDRYG